MKLFLNTLALVFTAFLLFPTAIVMDVLGYPLHSAYRKMGGEAPDPLLVLTPVVVGKAMDYWEGMDDGLRSIRNRRRDLD